MDFHSHGEVVPAYNPYFPPPTSMMSLLSGTQEQNQTEDGHQPPPTIMFHHPPLIPDHHHQHQHHHHQNQYMQAECKGFSSIPLNPFGEWGYNDSKPEISAKFSDVFLASTGNPLTPLEVDNAIIGTLHDNKDYNMSRNGNESSDANIIGSEEEYLIRKRRAKIRSHPRYQQLVALYINCQKVGASPDLVASLDKVGKEYESMDAINRSGDGPDPELDQFMEEYCRLLQSLQEELTAPFKEAMGFFRKMEQQLNTLSIKLSHSGDEEMELLDASSEDEGGSYGELDAHDMNPLAEDTKIKEQLLRKYGSYIGTLKKEFLKKRKKGKLPKDARLQLLDWWTKHYRWPYPSEGEKTSLAHSTGLDQKQINNWFINQRKRHWKPSEDNIDHYGMADGTSNSGSLETALLPMG